MNKKTKIMLGAVCAVCAVILVVVCVYFFSLKQEDKGTKDNGGKGTGDQTAEVEKDSKNKKDSSEEAKTEFTQTGDLIYTTSRVNLRAQPNTSSKIAATLEAGQELERLGKSDKWSKVTYDKKVCFISNDYITSEKPKQTTRVIAIDAGHQRQGDSSQEPIGPGAKTTKPKVASGTSGRTSGLAEYELTLQVALKLQKELESRGYKVVMIRTTNDVNISNADRAKAAAKGGAEVFVRLHANGAENTSVNGALSMAPSKSNPYVASLAAESNRLASCILNQYCTQTGLKSQGVVETDKMSGINWCTMPVTILEMGYMTNPEDDRKMADPDFRNKMVKGIADGLDVYFK